MSTNLSLAKGNNFQRVKAKQFGGSLIMAIIMIVVFSLLAAAMVRITNSNSNSLSYHALGQRAYQAAARYIQTISELLDLLVSL